MNTQVHPFHAIAALAASRGMGNLKLMVERDGAYVRLYQDSPAIFFKYRLDPSDNIDRASFGTSKRILLSDDDCANGPDSTLELIEMLLEKFADYEHQPTQKTPKSGRDK
jgi:hypothetical protein